MTAKHTAEQLKQMAINALEDLKGKDIKVLDVRKLTGVTDFMIICSGTSNRHVKSLADNVEVELKKEGIRALGVEGQQDGEWVLVDFGDVVVHVMMAETRAFYDLEQLWSVAAG
ncbi:MAG TPA: ribosome silencing factor [Spongiibacteraceae bacterium]|nr:ribosome silencing factor [Spongiibacteraceae bacterium]HUH37823.1 ribosome silencing factor [Spongiibacteraceae bacterium]